MSYLDLFKFTPFKSGSGMCYPSSDYGAYYEASAQGCVGGAKKSKKSKKSKKHKTTKKPKKKATRKTTKKRASKKKTVKKIVKKGGYANIDNMVFNSSYKSSMIRRPVTAKTVASRRNSGNYNRNAIGSISLENYIGGKKTKKQKAGSLTCCDQNTPDFDASKLSVFTTLRKNLENLIPFR